MSDTTQEPTQPIPIHEVEPAFAGYSLDVNSLKSSLLRTAFVGAYFCALTLIVDRAPVESVGQTQPATTDIQGPTTTTTSTTLPMLDTDNPAEMIGVLGDGRTTHQVVVGVPKGVPKPDDGVMDAGFNEELQDQIYTYERHYHTYTGRTDQTLDCLMGEIVLAEPGDSINRVNHRHHDNDTATEQEGMSIYDAIGFESAAVALNIQRGVIESKHDPIQVGDAVYVLSACVMTIHSEQPDGTVAIFQKVIPNDELQLAGTSDGGWIRLNPDIDE